MIYKDPDATETEREGFRFATLAVHGAVYGMNQRKTLIIPLSALTMFEWSGQATVFVQRSSSLFLDATVLRGTNSSGLGSFIQNGPLYTDIIKLH
jgi:hypothetical protein